MHPLYGDLPKGSELILLVDDEQPVIELTKDILEFLGYSVKTTLNPCLALEIFKENPKQFDLVITDMTMPQMTGAQLVKELLAIQPDLPTILCTGYSSLISEDTAKQIGISKYMTKPFTMETMAYAIREVLDS